MVSSAQLKLAISVSFQVFLTFHSKNSATNFFSYNFCFFQCCLPKIKKFSFKKRKKVKFQRAKHCFPFPSRPVDMCPSSPPPIQDVWWLIFDFKVSKSTSKLLLKRLSSCRSSESYDQTSILTRQQQQQHTTTTTMKTKNESCLFRWN